MRAPYQSYSQPQGVYLSIDLDFWALHPMPDSDRRWLWAMLRRAASVACFPRHDHALKHINSPKIADEGREIWNLDTHSDLVGFDVNGRPPELNEGTWGDFIRWPKAERFLWIHPDVAAAKTNGRGRCEGHFPNPFRVCHPIWPVRRHCVRPRQLSDMDLPMRLVGACVILSKPWYETKAAQKDAQRVYQQVRREFT